MPNQEKKCKKRLRKHHISSGKKYTRKVGTQLRRILMKIARWERNQSNPKKVKAGKSKKGWDTTSLQKHVDWLRGQVKRKRQKKSWFTSSSPSLLAIKL